VSDPCPRCDGSLSHGGGFCRACGYDADLQAADWRGDGTELPDAEYDYQRLLRSEGLGGEGQPFAWTKLVAVVAAVALVLLLLRGLR